MRRTVARRRGLLMYLAILGPGMITANAGNDAGGIATFASVGAEIAYQVMENAFDYLDAPIKRVSTVEAPMPYARNLEVAALPSVEKIVAAVKEVCYL